MSPNKQPILRAWMFVELQNEYRLVQLVVSFQQKELFRFTSQPTKNWFFKHF